MGGTPSSHKGGYPGRCPGRHGSATASSLGGRRHTHVPNPTLNSTPPRLQISVPARIAQFPEQSFRDSFGHVMCGACVAVIPNIKSTLVKHTHSLKHIARLIVFNAKTTEDIDLMASLSAHFRANPDEAGATVNVHEQLYRFRVTQAFMFAGVALYKASMLRTLLERSGHSCTSGTHLAMYVPKVEEREIRLVQEELKDEYIHSMFDGTSRVGELLNNVLRWCTSDFELMQRLALLMTYQKHLSGAQAARVLTTLYMTVLSIPIPRMIGFGRDSVSANAVTLRSLKPVFTHAEDMLCICHTLMNMGKHFHLGYLDEFMSKWIAIIYGTSPHAKAIWKRTIDVALVGYSTVRWYSEGEIIIQNAQIFPLIKPFLKQLVDEGVCPTLAPAALDILERGERLLKLQHAAIVDMKMVISLTYDMEGDLIPQLLAYQRIEALRGVGRHIANGVPGALPTVEAILRATTELKKGAEMEKVKRSPHLPPPPTHPRTPAREAHTQLAPVLLNPSHG